MRITKEKASQVARDVTNPIQLQIDGLNKDLKNLAINFVKKSIPAEVLRLAKKHPKHFERNDYVYLRGVGIARSIQVSFDELYLPFYDTTLVLDAAQSKEVVRIWDKIQDLNQKRKETILRLETTLLGLSTYKRAAEQLPEIAQYLQEPTSTAIALPIKEIRKELKALVA